MFNVILSLILLWLFSWMFVKLDNIVDDLVCYMKSRFSKKKEVTVSYDIWKDLETPPLREAYLKVYRFFFHISEFPENACREIKWAYQRVFRKWDDRVCWSIDWYLCEIMPSILKKFKEQKHGYPCAMIQEDDKLDEHGNTTDEIEELCIKRWNDIIDGLIKMFETAKNVHDKHWFIQESKNYSQKEANRYRRIQKELRQKKPEWYDEDFGKILTKKECLEYEKNWENFRKYFSNLWD